VLRKKQLKSRSQIMHQTHSKSLNCPIREASLMQKASLSVLRRNQPLGTILLKKHQHLRIVFYSILPVKIARDKN